MAKLHARVDFFQQIQLPNRRNTTLRYNLPILITALKSWSASSKLIYETLSQRSPIVLTQWTSFKLSIQTMFRAIYSLHALFVYQQLDYPTSYNNKALAANFLGFKIVQTPEWCSIAFYNCFKFISIKQCNVNRGAPHWSIPKILCNLFCYLKLLQTYKFWSLQLRISNTWLLF